jgi:putative sterol carrier protein
MLGPHDRIARSASSTTLSAIQDGSANLNQQEAFVPAFKDEAEVYEYMGRIFETGLASEEIGPKLKSSGVVLRIHCTEPDSVMTVDMPGGVVHTGAATGPQPDVELFMTADTGNRFWLGKVNMTLALAKGQVRAQGPMSKVLKLMPIAKSLFVPYREQLEAAGRTDLLNA